jgi:hypothetical protein
MLGKNKNFGLYLHQCLNVEMGHRKWTLGFDSISYLRTVKIKRLSDNIKDLPVKYPKKQEDYT